MNMARKPDSDLFERVRFRGRPVANPASVVADGNIRLTVLTPRLLRLEWSETGAFEDRASYAFPTRHAAAPPFDAGAKDGVLAVDTGALTLRYVRDSGRFTDRNLSISFEFGGRPWVLYLTALKPCKGNYATFLDPLLFSGREGASRWQQAVAAIPPNATRRIQAMVVDNLPGMKRIAQRHGWPLQLCHFHLLLKLQAHRRGVRYTLRGGSVREEIHRLIRNALELSDEDRLSQVLKRLAHLSHDNCGTLRIQTTVREFLLNLEYYRAYLAHPQLDLPHTTNSVESMGRLLREMFRSSRAGSNPASLLLWATTFIRLRPTVTCNGHPFNRLT